MGLSARGLAEHLGLASDNSVRYAVKKGRLRDCILPDGTYDAAIAEREWRANTDPRQQRAPPAALDAARATPSSPPPPTRSGADALAQHLASNQGRTRRVGADAAMAELLRVKLLQEIEDKAFDSAVKRREYVDRAATMRAVTTLSRALRDAFIRAIDRAAVHVAGDLGTDEHATFAAMDRHAKTLLLELMGAVDEGVLSGILADA